MSYSSRYAHPEAEPRRGLWRALARRWWWIQIPFVGFIVAELYAAPKISRNDARAVELRRTHAAELAEVVAERRLLSDRLVAVDGEGIRASQGTLSRAGAMRDSLRERRGELDVEITVLDASIEGLGLSIGDLAGAATGADYHRREARGEVVEHEMSVSALQDSLAIAAREENDLLERRYSLQHPEEFLQSPLIAQGRE